MHVHSEFFRLTEGYAASYTTMGSLCDITDKLDLTHVYRHIFAKKILGEKDIDYLLAALAS